MKKVFMKYIAIAVLMLIYPMQGRAQETPLFSFGLMADVQYADVDTWGKRDYRGSLKRLENSIRILNTEQLQFVIHAGDLIDRDYRSFDLPLGIFGTAKAEVHFVIGNHEFSVADSLKSRVRRRLNNPRGYYRFVADNFQFILVDAMDVSVHSTIAGTREHNHARKIQEQLRAGNVNNAHDYNGGLGADQLRWLKRSLRRGERRGYRTLLFSHLPLLPENGLQMWNNRDVLALLEQFPGVIAFVSGHHHEGGYVKSGAVHHLTLRGLVESRAEAACAIADVFPNKIVIRGFGDQPGYTLEY
jgi:3',5'-cyclic AMP phosphodiesterase CpdA